MVIKICDRCQQRYSVARHVSDYVHACTGGDATLDNDDILITGSYSDWGGGGNPSKFSVMLGGLPNDLEGTRAGLEGGEDESRTNRGKKTSLYRQRQHFAYKEFKPSNG
jgi:hypothetical protein